MNDLIKSALRQLTTLVALAVLEGRAEGDTTTTLGDRSGEGSTPFTGLAKSPEANLFTGALGTSIPIELPPGRKNMTPQLAFQYSSTGGPGPFGYGWDLPIGRIERSTKWGVPRCGDELPPGHPQDTDGDDHANEFVLVMPGVTAELINDPPNSQYYRPIIEQSYLRVTRNGDNTFTAIDRGGMKYFFGRSGARAGTDIDKFMEQQPNGFCAFTTTWALTQIDDPNGNSIYVTWMNYSGVLYPMFIRYGGNFGAEIDPIYTIAFDYQLVHAEDLFKSHRTGAPSELVFRLESLEIYAFSDHFRNYTFHYNDHNPSYTHADGPRSLLVAVSKTGYPTQHFAYAPPIDQHDASAPIAIAPPVPGQNYLRAWDDGQEVYQTILDMNGDGLADIIRTNATALPQAPPTPTPTPTPGGAIWTVYEGLANEIGFDTGKVWQLPPALQSQRYLRFVLHGEGEARTTKDVFDITGDGIPDYVDASGDTWLVWAGGATPQGVWGFGGVAEDGSWTADPSRPPRDWISPRALIRIDDMIDGGSRTYQDTIDVNGDGRPDLVYTEPGESAPYNWKVYLNTGTGFEPEALPYFPAPWGYISETVPNENLGNGTTREPILSDFNGDGLPDMLRTGPADPHDPRCGSPSVLAKCLEVYFNTGQGFALQPQLETISAKAISVQDTRRLGGSGGALELVVENDVLDINGDGLPDWVEYHGPGGYRVQLNVGGRLEAAGFEPHPGPQFTQQRVATRQWDLVGPIRATDGHRSIADMIDIDGDGMLDRIDTSTVPWQLVRNRPETFTKPNLLTVMENGVGGTNTVLYAPSTLYDNTGGDAKSDLPSVNWVVAALRQNDGCVPSGNPENVNVFVYDSNTCLQFGHDLVTNIIYQDGRFDSESREFRGFRTVVQRQIDGPNTSPQRNDTVTVFGQDDLTKGQILQVEHWAGRSGTGAMVRLEQNGWQSQQLALHDQLWLGTKNVITLDLQSSAPLFQITSNSPPDQYGNTVHSYRSDLFGINRVDTCTEYADYGTPGYPQDRPSHSKTTDSTLCPPEDPCCDVGRLEEKWFYYDGPPGGAGLPLHDIREGNLVRAVSWLNTPGSQNPETRMLYDAVGNIVWLMDANNHSTFTTYDSSALHEERITKQLSTSQLHTDTETDYRWGKPTLVRDPNGSATDTRYEYDDAGRITCVAHPGDVPPDCTMKYEYHFGSGPNDLSYVQVKQKQNAAGEALRYTKTIHYFDALGRPAYADVERVVDGGASLTVVRADHVLYDAGGRVTMRHHPYPASGSPTNGTTVYEYLLDGVVGLNDPLGRVHRVTKPDQSSTRTLYRGRETISYDEEGHKTITEVDNLGNVVDRQIFQGDASSWYARFEYDYDGLGRLLTVRQNGLSLPMTANTYDSLGRKTQTVDRDSGTWRYVYDSVGNLRAQDDPKSGQHAQYCYDEINRPVRRCLLSSDYQSVSDCSASCTGEAISYQYDTGVLGAAIPNGKGRLTRVVDESGETLIEAYDARGRVETSTKTIGDQSATVSYTYDAADRVRTTTYPDGEVVVTEYDASGQPSALKRSTGAYYIRKAHYDLFGRMKRLEHAGNDVDDDVVRTMTYHPSGMPNAGPGEGHKLKTILVQKSSASYLNLQYSDYSPRGLLARIDDTRSASDPLSNDVTYTYDHMGRLDHATANPLYDHDHDYDALGNIRKMGTKTFLYGDPAIPQTRPHQPTSTQISGGQVVPVDHDPNGNREDIGNQQYQFTAEDRLESIHLGNESVDFVYDHEGRMAIKTDGINGSETRYFGDLAETTSAGLLTKWYFFAGMRVASVTTNTWSFAAVEEKGVEIAGAWLGRPVVILSLSRDAQIGAAGATSLLAAVLFFLPWRRRRVVGIAVRQGHVIGVVIAFTIGTVPYPLLIRAAGAQECDDPTPTAMAPSNTPTSTRTPTRTPTATRTATRTPTPVPMTEVRHYHHDHLGSVQLITDENGEILEQIRYYPYGQIRGRWYGNGTQITTPDPDGRHEFTDYETEINSGLQYAGARFYDPTFASFLTHDPARQFASPYTYTNWNPTNFTDPTGAELGTVIGLFVFGFIVGFTASALQAADNGARSQDALKAGLIGGAVGGATAVGLGFLSGFIASQGSLALSVTYQGALASAAGYGAYEGFRTGNGVLGAFGAVGLALGVYGIYNLVSAHAAESTGGVRPSRNYSSEGRRITSRTAFPGSSDAMKTRVIQAEERVFATTRGRAIASTLATRPVPLEVRLVPGFGSRYFPSEPPLSFSDFVQLDPTQEIIIDFPPPLAPGPASLERIFAHELGHALGFPDDWLNTNIYINENPIAVELGEPPRTLYR